jgi:hypothetical protein
VRWLPVLHGIHISSSERRVFLGFVRLLALLFHRTAGVWQLQHCRRLALTKIRYKHNLAVGKLQRVMVRRRTVEIDLAETGNLMRCLARRQKAE